MTNSLYKNPFIECTARDMTYEEVFNFWCSPFGCYRIDEKQLFSSHTPLILEGARGSGKTMILKYLSYFCQKEIAINCGESDVIGFICRRGGLGFYYRYNSNFDEIINKLNCKFETKRQLFEYYYNLFLSLEIIDVLKDIQDNGYVELNEMENLLESICELFDIKEGSFKGVKDIIEDWTYDIDDWVRNFKYNPESEKKLHFLIRQQDIVRKLCGLIKKSISEFSNVEMLILIDEYENVKYFQKITNTWLRSIDNRSPLTYRIGTRPQGIETYDTEYSEEIRDGRDYILCSLICQNISSYKKFLKEVSTRRLNKVPFFKENDLLDITSILGMKENFDEEALKIIQNKEDIFDKLHIEKTIREYLECEDKPLMQMLNIMWFLRGKKPEIISAACKAYNSGKYDRCSNDIVLKEAYKYKLDYAGKYRLQLLCVLCGLYKVSKAYYSFNTFAYLSTGVVNDFISLCRNTFYHLDDIDLDELSKGKIISIRIQTKGAEDTANEQLDQIQVTDEYGSEMHDFAMNIGSVFAKLHKDIKSKYPETTQLAFENEAEIDSDQELKAIKNCMLKWGVIQKKYRRQRISIGKKKGNIYRLNKMYTPIFNISYRTRGGYNYILSIQQFRKLIGCVDSYYQLDLFEEGYLKYERE